MLRTWIIAWVVATVRIAVADEAWSPLDHDGWPKGESISTLRHLRPCGIGELQATPGAPIPCRPPVLDGVARFAFTMDWTSGIAFGSELTTGGSHAWGNELLYAATRSVQIGLRYEMTGISTPSAMTLPNAGFGHHLFGIARYRHFVDEVDRSAWSFGAGAGWAVRTNALGGPAPLARLSLAREIGMYLDDDNALTMGLELAYERSLGEEPLQAVLASAKFGFETNIREPANLGERASDRGARYTLSGGWLVGPALGLDFSLGLGGRSLSLTTTLGYLFGRSDFSKQHGFDGAQWSAISGPRLAKGVVYLQAQAGAAWTPQQTGGEVRAIGQAELGLGGMVAGCYGTELGFWLRNDLESDFGITAGGLVLRVLRASRPHGSGSCGRESFQPAFAVEPPPPPPPPVREVIVERTSIEPAPVVVATPPPRVAIEIRPIVLDLELGASLLGGAVQVRIDPRILPLDRLRDAGFVSIELFGPASALGSFESQLRGAIHRGRARIDAWASIPTASSSVRARFTIWPPGARVP
jgi:hypothetical protein